MLSNEERMRKISAFKTFVSGSFSDEVLGAIELKLDERLSNLAANVDPNLVTETYLDQLFSEVMEVAFAGEITAASLPFSSE